MIEEICPNLYRMEVPLPRNPLKAVNSYVIKARERNLIVDTGMNREECMSAMRRGLSELNVDLTRTDFFITHLHADHLGLVSSLATDSSSIYFNQPDADLLNRADMWEQMVDLARTNGFPESELRGALEKHPGYKYSLRILPKFTILKDGDTISVGEYRFECVQTPGHTRGHMCLYEPQKKVLVAGDHILDDITPNISQWAGEDNTLEQYLASLDRVYALDIEVTDLDPDRLARAQRLFPPADAASHGVAITYVNPRELAGGPDALVQFVRKLTDGRMMDDVFVFFPSERLVEQADSLLGRNGCLNFFAGPPRTDFRAGLNFYDVHYEGHHIVGTSGGNTQDMLLSLDLMSKGRIDPGGMITHVGGLDSAARAILDLPRIHGGKKLIYTHVQMPLVGLDELGARAEEAEEPLRGALRELDRIVHASGGVWCAEAERFLLACDRLRAPDE